MALQTGHYGCRVSINNDDTNHFEAITMTGPAQNRGRIDELNAKYHRLKLTNYWFFKCFKANIGHHEDTFRFFVKEKTAHNEFIIGFDGKTGADAKVANQVKRAVRSMFSIDIDASCPYAVKYSSIVSDTLNYGGTAYKLCSGITATNPFALGNTLFKHNEGMNEYALIIILPKIGDNDTFSIPTNLSWPSQSFINLLQKVTFMNNFKVHNDMHGGNMVYDTKRKEFNIIDMGLARNANDAPYEDTSGQWDRLSENIAGNGQSILRQKTELFNTFINSNNQAYNLAIGNRGYLLGQSTALKPFNITGDQVANNALLTNMINEFIEFKSSTPPLTYNIATNLKRDFYNASSGFHKHALNGVFGNGKLIQAFCILFGHPNSFLRPFPDTIIRIFDKLTKQIPHRFSLKYTIDPANVIELLNIPNVTTSSEGYDLNRCKVNTDIINFKNTPLYRRMLDIDYFITMNLLCGITFCLNSNNCENRLGHWFDFISVLNNHVNMNVYNMLKNITFSDFASSCISLSHNAASWEIVQTHTLRRLCKYIYDSEPWTLNQSKITITQDASGPVFDFDNTVYEPYLNTPALGAVIRGPNGAIADNTRHSYARWLYALN